MPPSRRIANAQNAKTSFLAYEKLDGRDVLKVLDNLNDILPIEQQVYTINGDKQIDQRQILRDMCRRIRKGELAVSYLYSKSSLSHGRQYALGGRSVQSLSRVLRHTLCAKTYRDFDIVNCHPTIALHYCKMKGWDVPNLQRYVTHREDVITELMTKNPTLTRDYIKQDVFISILNGGSAGYKSVHVKTDVLVGMYDEVREVFGKMLELDENKALLEEVRKSKKGKTPEEIRRSVCNKVFVDIENDILNTCVEWCKHMGMDIRNIVLMFDGFMLPIIVAEKMPKNWEEILSDYVEMYSKSHIRVQFTEKEMNEGVDLEKYKLKSIYQEALGDGVDDAELTHYAYNQTDGGMCDLICKVFAERFISDGNRLYYFHNHRWCDNGDDIYLREVRNIYQLYDPIVLQAKTAMDNATEEERASAKEHYLALRSAQTSFQTGGSLKRAKEFLMSQVHRSDFTSLLDSQAGIVGFENGVWDLRGEKPVFRDGVPEDYVSLTTGYNYIPPTTTDIAEKFLRDIVDEETYPTLLQFMGSILYGGNKEHKATFIVGSGSNGKSLLCEIISKVLGLYLRNIPKEIYTREKKHAGGAEPHLMELKGRLIGLTNETEESDKFIAGTFKSMSSSDEITTRGLFEKRQTIFTPLYKPIISTNYKPSFTSFDDGVARRIRIFTFPYQFVEPSRVVNEPDEDGKVTIVKKPRDLELGEKLKRPEVICQFVKLMVDNLCKGAIQESETMKNDIQEYLGELNPLSKWFGDRLTASSDPKEKITSEELWKDYQSYSRQTISQRAFGMMLNKLVTLKRSSSCMVLRGYSWKSEEETDD